MRGGSDAANAELELARLPQDRVTAMVVDRLRALPEDDQRAAVMLHTDTAYALLLANVRGAGLFHIAVARRVFAAMKAAGRDSARTQEFERRWFAFVVGMLTSTSIFDRADVLLRDALTLYPREPRLHVASGAFLEAQVASGSIEARLGSQVLRRDRALEAAAAAYRRAIAIDPLLAMAYLRLGWLHVMQHDKRAHDDLDEAARVAADPTDRYLAHLLRGGLAERESQLDEARRQYEAALAIGPDCQSPHIALARVETALGHASRAAEISRTFAALTEKANDPWWDFHLGGFDDTALRWLRREATAR